MQRPAGARRHRQVDVVMDTILVVNAGSSSVKFQLFGVEVNGALRRLIKGQIDGIGTKPRLVAEASDKSSLINKTYARTWSRMCPPRLPW